MFRWNEDHIKSIVPRHDVICSDPDKLIRAFPMILHFTEQAQQDIIAKNTPLSLQRVLDVQALVPLEPPPPTSRRSVIIKALVVTATVIGGAILFI